MAEPSMELETNRGILKLYPSLALIHVSGSDAHKWLQGIVTADLSTLTDQAFWGLMLQRNGKVRCEIAGVSESGGTWLAAIGGNSDEIYEYLDSMILMDDVEVTRVPKRAFWAVHAASSDIAREISARHLPTLCKGSLRWFGERDLVFILDEDKQAAWLEALRELGLEPCTEESFERVRIRSGVPKWSVDFSTQDTPHHAGLFGRAVAVSKGCYIGQEVVCKAEMIGRVSSRLTRVEVETLAGVEVGATVLEPQTGESVGVTTSVAPKESGPGGWVIARVKSALIEKGRDVRIGQGQGRIVDVLVA